MPCLALWWALGFGLSPAYSLAGTVSLVVVAAYSKLPLEWDVHKAISRELCGSITEQGSPTPCYRLQVSEAKVGSSIAANDFRPQDATDKLPVRASYYWE